MTSDFSSDRLSDWNSSLRLTKEKSRQTENQWLFLEFSRNLSQGKPIPWVKNFVFKNKPTKIEFYVQQYYSSKVKEKWRHSQTITERIHC